MHPPIFFKKVGLSFSSKDLFHNFSGSIQAGSRIGLIGNNGSGKSCFLRLLCKTVLPSHGQLVLPHALRIGYIPQVLHTPVQLSGGQRFQKRFTRVLASNPSLLLLDEPTNYLDSIQRKHLIKRLQRYPGTLVIVTHDTTLLDSCTHMIWHIANEKIHVFPGLYIDYMRLLSTEHKKLRATLSYLKIQHKKCHTQLMRDQVRAKKRKAYGVKKYKRDKLALQAARASGEITTNKNRKAIAVHKAAVLDTLSHLAIPQVIKPTFSLAGLPHRGRALLSITQGAMGYDGQPPLVKNINLVCGPRSRIAILGSNASGKSTFLKAILGSPGIFRTGDWQLPSFPHIGYLDQHYANLYPEISVIQHLYRLRPAWSHKVIRRHLADFLFCTTDDVNKLVMHLSGGEQARLALALIAAATPQLLLLDEMSNNLDLTTKAHLIQVLRKYPVAMLIVTHDPHLPSNLGVQQTYTLLQGKLVDSS